jgi:transcription-repair coupling factor (superfamily II helicase)
MRLASLPSRLRDEPAMVRVVGAASATLAAPVAAQPFVVAGLLALGDRRPVLVVAATGLAAEHLARDIGTFAPGASVDVFPAWETLPFERVSPEGATMGRRLATLWHLAGGDGNLPDVVVAPIKAVLQRLGPWRHAAEPVVVERGARVGLDDLVAALVDRGYRREPLVEHRGELAVRGGIVDVFPSTGESPVRIDLWGDEVDRLAHFDLGDQRSVDDLDRVEIFGCRELRPDAAVRERAARLVAEAPWGRHQWDQLADGALFDGMESWLPWVAPGEELVTDLLGPGGLVVLVEPGRIRDRAADLVEEEAALADALASTWGLDDGSGSPRLHLPYDRVLERCRASTLSLVPPVSGGDVPSVVGSGWEPILGDPERLTDQVRRTVEAGCSVVLCSQHEAGASRMADALAAEGMVVPVRLDDADEEADHAAGARAFPGPAAQIVVAPIDRGFILPVCKVAVLGESDLTGRHRPHRPPRARARAVDGFFDDLAPGSPVVHRQHGVAIYRGMVTRTMGGATRDYLLLEYRGNDKLYLPTDQIDLLTPYTGGDSPTVHRLGGSEWQRSRAKARAAVHEIAEELVTLYRRRLEIEGRAFGPDTPWQAELEAGFPFEETADQVRAIEETKADMERPQPMDRLVCGDVGFGKTEVALRAVFKAVQEGAQAAILVPTTLLASQHAQTFADRFSPFPVRVELLSRFLTASQVKDVLAGLADGSVDVVVATHRLLAGDVSFKNLGLLVVDEEQRFGVSHKEAIKALTAHVDVLTLTASPIPRTLEMALTGIRDLSMVNTPPASRRPILTHVGEFDEAAVSEAIRREMLREGQVFYVHNRVDDIDAVAERVRRLVPGARVAVAHGQMDEGTLERVVLDFFEGAYDVLVCTTIIESGIDMPAVNTLIVDRADLLGLGQLHQLRGRVGRAGQRAYAYLFHPADRVLSEQAYERLRTIGDHTELGSGFKIALRDLQIRGAGNLLGRNQSGHIAAIGYDLYVQMVSEAVAELKGESRPAPVELSLDLPDVAFLPADYIESEDARLEAYRRLAAVRDASEVDDVRSEWLDRFGPPPTQARTLLEVALLRTECVRLGITDLAVQVARRMGSTAEATARIAPLVLPASAEVRLARLVPGARWHAESSRLVAPIPPAAAGTSFAARLVELLRMLVPPPAGPGPAPGPEGTAGAGSRPALAAVGGARSSR